MPSFLKDLLYRNPNTGEYAEMGTKGSGDYYYHGDTGFDASQLTPEQQYMLFLADKRYDETASFKGVDTPEELRQFWVDEHWGGTPKDINKDGKIDESEQSSFNTTLKDRKDSWDDSSKHYQKNKMGLYQDTLLDQIIPQQKEKDAQKEAEEAKAKEMKESLVKKVMEYIKADGSRRKCAGGDGRRSENHNCDKVHSGMTHKEWDASKDTPKDEASGGKEAYKKFFDAKLKKYGVSSPAELKGDDKKKFYDEIDAEWEGDNEED